MIEWPKLFGTSPDADTQSAASPSHKIAAVTTDIGGRLYRICSDDNYLTHIDGVFEPQMVALFDSLLAPEHTVLDIGANIGCTAILFGSRVRRVHAFEPSPSTYGFLTRNVDAAGLDSVMLHNVGLGRESGAFELTFAADNRSGGFVSDKAHASAGHTVEQIRIERGDTFLHEREIDGIGLVKIDVEGFELNVIDGLSETLARDRPVVVLEMNHWCLNVFQRIALPDFLDRLRAAFPFLYAIDGDEARNLHDPDDAYHVMYHHVVGGFRYPNLVGAFHPQQLERFAGRFGVRVG